jgi:hypothetical protein
MQTLSVGSTVLVTLGPGEEIIASLLQVAEAHEINGGFLTGLGSTSEVEIAFFDPVTKQYLNRVFAEPMEIGHLTGNLSLFEGGHHLHAHAVIAGQEMLAFAGHLVRGVVGTACEVYIQKIARDIQRVKDPVLGFNPLRIGS